jgi:CheY-like chemotaxis protein
MAEPLVVALVPDLMFASRIDGTLRQLGYRVTVVKDATALHATVRADGPALVLVDLAARRVDVPAAIAALKADAATRALPVVAFGPHLDETARDAAAAAGADAVVANSKLALDLPRLVARYATPDGP